MVGAAAQPGRLPCGAGGASRGSGGPWQPTPGVRPPSRRRLFPARRLGPAGRRDGGLAVADFDFTDPAMDAYAYSEAVADRLGEERVQPYFEALVGELFELVPGLRERFSDALLAEHKEEIAQDDTEFAAACRNAIVMVEERWRNDD